MCCSEGIDTNDPELQMACASEETLDWSEGSGVCSLITTIFDQNNQEAN